ncbi:uncharacterized protein LOC133523404 [Cydia pomonella]|uniref:uncharacterized protein LOC133523404 n=1 Tax=Cydia pomonella TaxID=82600 RepID=UPI002ADE0B67|nr:uncharacterized protein LOC133523404 [Cydia pomonella]
MEEISYLLKCSVNEQLHLNRTQFLTNASLSIPSVTLQVTKTVGLGAIVGLLLVTVANFIFNQKFRAIFSAPSWKNDKNFGNLNAKTLPRSITLIILALMLPLIIAFLLLALVYKLACAVIIKNKDKYFVGFLDSFDVFWSLEDDTTKSVISVLGVIESDSPTALVLNIKHKLLNIFSNKATDKLFFRRSEEYGFYYWRRYSSIDINQYVEMIDFPKKPDMLNTEDLEILMSDISNQSLPYNDEALFKILVTKQRVSNYGQERGEYGIVFRIHHSVGDGVALIEFLCKTLADDKNDCAFNMFSNAEKYNTRIRDSPKNLIDMMEKLLEMPICFVDGIIRKPDDNSLHGPVLFGKKIFKWTESDENLLTMVKEIKDSVDNMKFTDVLASALSSGLHKYFSKTMTHIPMDVAVVLPVRFPPSTIVVNGLVLENDFSVTILDLPVNTCKREEVQERCDELRRSADPLTNYYLLKIFNSVLPKQVLLPVFNSSQATMVFSNLPGPARLNICGGNTLKKLVFFVPLKGNTGLGVTALCYDGILRFGAVADSALVSSPDQLAIILDGMVEEIQRMHQMVR